MKFSTLFLGLGFMCVSHAALAMEMNCNLTQQSSAIDADGQIYHHDISFMNDVAENVQACIDKCSVYSAMNIEPNVGSFAALAYKCHYMGKVEKEVVFKALPKKEAGVEQVKETNGEEPMGVVAVSETEGVPEAAVTPTDTKE